MPGGEEEAAAAAAEPRTATVKEGTVEAGKGPTHSMAPQ